MYLPPHFAAPDEAACLDLARSFPFAVLITAPGGAPFATHLPLLVRGGGGEPVRLVGHVARRNPQAEHLADGEALAVFQGPHALVHPAAYASAPNVPTWNYAVVHARGPVSRLSGDAHREAALALVAAFTPDAAELPPAYEAGLLQGIVSFELRVTALTGKFKLSQNRSPEDRAGVRAALAGSARPEERDTAALMARLEGARP